MKLFRPVGVAELELIAASGWSAYPPRLSHQPIFYPVLNFEYAEAIAKNWNTKDEVSGYAGFVTEFEIDDEFVARYDVQVVGSREDQQLWVPAEDLELFNQNIEGLIEVTAHYFGGKFAGKIDSKSSLPTSVIDQISK